MTADKPASLDGIRVLDLSRILAGPTATQLLGDLGAEVIKVEKPGSGDDTRTWGPPFVADAYGGDSDLSAYFLCANRNKKSIAIDIATEDGASLVRKLASMSDIVVENFKPGDLDRRCLGYGDIRGLKPDIIWCSISGFGQTGPYASRIGYDFLIQAMGGIMSVTGEPDADGGRPTKVGVGIADVMCGMYATVGILAALRHRDRTGEGQFIDLSLYDSQVAWLINAATNHLVSGRTPSRLGNNHPNIAPYQTFATCDDDIAIAVGNDTQFDRFASVIGRPDLASDSRFKRNRDRLGRRDELERIIATALSKDTANSWVERFTAAGVPAGRVASIDQVLTDPHTLARGMVVSVPVDGGGGAVRLLGNPLNLSHTPVRYHSAPPHLDEHRDEVLNLVSRHAKL